MNRSPAFGALWSLLLLFLLVPTTACSLVPSARMESVAISPDGKLLTIDFGDDSSSFIYKIDVESGNASRLTDAGTGKESRAGGPPFGGIENLGAPSFRAFCERVGSTDVNFNEKTGRIGLRFPPLQRTQGWGTLFRGGPHKGKVGHPPQHSAQSLSCPVAGTAAEQLLRELADYPGRHVLR